MWPFSLKKKHYGFEADKMCDMYDNVLHRCRFNHETLTSSYYVHNLTSDFPPKQ